MRIDFTLTLPGLFEVSRIQALADRLGVDILAKVVFAFTPDIVFSPLALPRTVLDRVVDQHTATLPPGALKDILLQLKQRPTFEEQWPDTYQQGLAKGRARVLQLEQIRGGDLTMDQILQGDPEIYEWWSNIGTS